jgi:hypothetical protein
MPTLPAMKAPVSPAPTTPSPTRARHRLAGSGRITGLDVARAIAVFGMFGAHVGAVPPDVRVAPATWLGVVNGGPSTCCGLGQAGALSVTLRPECRRAVSEPASSIRSHAASEGK